MKYREEIQELARCGMSTRAIANTLHLRTSQVRAALHSSGGEEVAEPESVAPTKMVIRHAGDGPPPPAPCRVYVRNGQRVNELQEAA